MNSELLNEYRSLLANIKKMQASDTNSAVVKVCSELEQFVNKRIGEIDKGENNEKI